MRAVESGSGNDASFTRRAMRLMTPASAVATTRPSTPFSRTPRAVRADSGSLTSTKMLPVCATKFSKGMTVQSGVLTTTGPWRARRMTSASSPTPRIVTSWRSFPGARSPSGAITRTSPRALTSGTRPGGTQMASAPDSRAAVTSFLSQGSTLTQSCFIILLDPPHIRNWATQRVAPT